MDSLRFGRFRDVKMQINLNADMAEGFGAYEIGDDEGILRFINSANIACGFHAGDPLTMRKVVRLARENGVSVGAHPGFNDLWGFGRRPIQMKSDDLESLVIYQIGALQAMAASEGMRVTHLKPHGALSNMAAVDRAYALAIGKAIMAVDPDLVYVAISGSEMERTGRELGLAVALEGFCDRQYEDDGNLTSRKIPGSVYKSPEPAVAQAMRMVMDKIIVSRSGKEIPCNVHTLCVHGDEPGGVAIASAVRDALTSAGVELVRLDQMDLRSHVPA
jgi:UPF0271 protein